MMVMGSHAAQGCSRSVGRSVGNDFDGIGEETELHENDEGGNEAVQTLGAGESFEDDCLTELAGVFIDYGSCGICHHHYTLTGAEAGDKKSENGAEKRDVRAGEEVCQESCEKAGFGRVFDEIRKSYRYG